MLEPHPTIDDIDDIDRPTRTAHELGYRMPAEFEPVECVWVVPPHNDETWPGCFDAAQAQHADWVDLMRPYVEVRTPGSLGIDTDDSWVRDFGPIFVVKGPEATGSSGQGQGSVSRGPDGSPLEPSASSPLACHDFRFNAWGAKYEAVRSSDDVVPQHLAQKLGLPLWVHDFVLEGGSIEVNGKGTLLTTQQCLYNANRNPWATPQVIERTLRDTLGVRHIIWLPGGIVGDDTDGHIDDVARFVSSDCVAIVVAPPGHPDHAVTQRNLDALKQARDQDDQPLRIVGLPVPEPIIYDFPALPSVEAPGPAPVPASYANFLITTDAVFVPVFGQETDDVACGVLEKVMPGRSIVPVRAEHLVVGLGALHCLSMQQPAV
ncbi:MAG: agmatine deiminase family protein [Phycisphaeraceae bacterium]